MIYQKHKIESLLKFMKYFYDYFKFLFFNIQNYTTKNLVVQFIISMLTVYDWN